ncbi:protein ARMCX6-like [Arvicola amphibius]|uniref:protein ARMCX6-like n=1 Tax=Arvicola amphibius TaxID=1047088 RepID=UPI001C09336B|nr:protein ARMCX6-like [Arvicola amphibius]
MGIGHDNLEHRTQRQLCLCLAQSFSSLTQHSFLFKDQKKAGVTGEKKFQREIFASSDCEMREQVREKWRKAAREGELERERDGERERAAGRLSVDLTKCAFIQGKKMFTKPTNAGFPLSHNVSRHWASLSVVANRIPTPQTTVREKALCVPENPNTSIGNQGQIEMSIDEVCRDTVLHCCKTFLEHGGLNLLISMTVINNMLAKPVLDLKFPLISEGSGCAKVQGLEALLGLSEKPVLAGEVLAAQMLFSFVLPFMRGGNREMLLEAFREMLVEALST